MRRLFSLLIKKELRHIFYSPLAYLASAIFLLLTGWFFSNSLMIVQESELRGMLDIMPLLLMFFLPAITMRAVAEEKKTGTLQLLLTMPVKEWEAILSKFLSCLSLYIMILLFTLPYVVVLFLLGRPDPGVIVTSYLGLILLGAVYIAITLFGSTLSSSQAIAFITGFSIIFVFFILSRLQMVLPLWLQSMVERFSIIDHYENTLRGLIRLEDILYFIMMTTLFLMLSVYVLKWRRG